MCKRWGDRMNVEAFIICWNESETLKMTIDYYRSFCSHIILYDNYSTDGSDEIAKSMGCEIRKFGIQGELNDKEYVKVKNKCWKGSEADYVIVCDADEIIYHPYLFNVLKAEKERGTTIFKPTGINVYSNEMPVKSFLEITTGVNDTQYSKTAIFSPKLKEIWFEYGCHRSDPRGKLIWNESEIYLLHYRCIGGSQRLIDRHEAYRQRLGDFNKRFNLGHHYLQENEERKAHFDSQLLEAKPLNFIRVV
jgi:glycosyltransferase involved in cell wall biosynthesis